MRLFGKTLLACVTLAGGGMVGAQSTAAGETEPAWAAYRSFYKFFTRFQGAEQQKRYPSLQLRMKLTPREEDTSIEALTLQIASASVRRQVTVDTLTGVDLPLDKAAADEDGVMRLNRPQGTYMFGTQHSIRVRADGVYAPAWLKQACEQGLAVIKTFDLTFRLFAIGKSCAGVTFVFRAGNDGSVVFRNEKGVERPLSGRSISYYGDNSPLRVNVVAYRFDDWPRAGVVVTRGSTDLIDFIFEY